MGNAALDGGEAQIMPHGERSNTPPLPRPPSLPPPSIGQFTAPKVVLDGTDLEKTSHGSKSEDDGTLTEPIQSSTASGPTYPDGGKQAYCAALGG